MFFEGIDLGLLKGQVLGPKFTTAEVSDANDNLYYFPIKHTIGDHFICEIDNQYFAFSLKNKRILTHKSKSGIGKYFQIIQYDTSNTRCLKPTTKELEIMLKENSLGKLDREKFEILSILARREKKDFGLWMVGEEAFETEKEARAYFDSLDDKTITKKDKNGKEVKEELKVYHNVHTIEALVKVFEAEEGEFPKKVKEIKKYLNSLDIREIVTPLRPITEFITNDLIAEDAGFLGEGMARAQRLDGTLREVTNVPVKPKGNMMKFMVIGLIVVVGVLGIYAANESGAFKGISDFTNNLGTIGEGFKGLPAPGQIVRAPPAGSPDYSDNAIMAKYPDCTSLEADVNAGLVDYNKLSSTVQGFLDSCQ